MLTHGMCYRRFIAVTQIIQVHMVMNSYHTLLHARATDKNVQADTLSLYSHYIDCIRFECDIQQVY